MKAFVAVTLAAALLLPAARAHACAGCRNPNMPITRLEAVHLAPGEVRAAAIFGATAIHVVHPAGCTDLANCTEIPIQPAYQHNQKIYPGEFRAAAEMGLTNTLGVELHVPTRVVRTTIKYTTPAGAPTIPLDPETHHRNETLAGIGDPWVLARWNTTVGGLLITARAGTSLPLGRTEPNPFALGNQGLRHQHIQFGSGTFDPVVGFDIVRPLARLQLTGYGQAQTALYQNRHGFRAGTRLFGGLQAGRRLFATLTGALGLDVLHEGPERWDGRIQQDGNLGRTELLLGVSLVQSF
ncbi:MAG: hypothetical protein H7X95_00490, partial [Deltaproteobacteria bacterium]|nr:hypothetical protein [Deltaproteobacteria bacterium]